MTNVAFIAKESSGKHFWRLILIVLIAVAPALVESLALAQTNSAPRAAAGPMTGRWNAKVDLAAGTVKYTFDIKQNGTNVTVRATRASDTETNLVPLTEVGYEFGSIRFVETMDLGDQRVRVIYRGAISPTNTNEMNMTRLVSGFDADNIVVVREASAVSAGATNTAPAKVAN